jgi:hypothetical protein
MAPLNVRAILRARFCRRHLTVQKTKEQAASDEDLSKRFDALIARLQWVQRRGIGPKGLALRRGMAY